jgi:hypothetical protein
MRERLTAAIGTIVIIILVIVAAAGAGPMSP